MIQIEIPDAVSEQICASQSSTEEGITVSLPKPVTDKKLRFVQKARTIECLVYKLDAMTATSITRTELGEAQMQILLPDPVRMRMLKKAKQGLEQIKYDSPVRPVTMEEIQMQKIAKEIEQTSHWVQPITIKRILHAKMAEMEIQSLPTQDALLVQQKLLRQSKNRTTFSPRTEQSPVKPQEEESKANDLPIPAALPPGSSSQIAEPADTNSIEDTKVFSENDVNTSLNLVLPKTTLRRSREANGLIFTHEFVQNLKFQGDSDQIMSARIKKKPWFQTSDQNFTKAVILTPDR